MIKGFFNTFFCLRNQPSFDENPLLTLIKKMNSIGLVIFKWNSYICQPFRSIKINETIIFGSNFRLYKRALAKTETFGATPQNLANHLRTNF